jgi:DNA-directed RNA polymerase specialized sigma24 family protein
MNKDALEKRRRIKSIKTKQEYEDFKNSINLTYEQNLLFDAVFMYGYDYRYIADNILNCTERTVKSKMKRLLEKL